MLLPMKIRNILLLIAAIVISCDINQTLISPTREVSTEEYSFSDYSDLSISHAFNVQVIFSDTEESIVIEANENLHQYIKVVKDGYSLSIGLDNNVHIQGNATLKAYVTTKALSNFSASGASRITVKDVINQTDVVIDLSGASHFTGEIQTEELKADLSGASEINISGFANECFISASGASRFRDYSLTTDFLYSDISGASLIYISINKEISIEASGASMLYYHGQAFPISQDLSGGSKIIKTE